MLGEKVRQQIKYEKKEKKKQNEKDGNKLMVRLQISQQGWNLQQ